MSAEDTREIGIETFSVTDGELDGGVSSRTHSRRRAVCAAPDESERTKRILNKRVMYLPSNDYVIFK